MLFDGGLGILGLKPTPTDREVAVVLLDGGARTLGLLATFVRWDGMELMFFDPLDELNWGVPGVPFGAVARTLGLLTTYVR